MPKKFSFDEERIALNSELYRTVDAKKPLLNLTAVERFQNMIVTKSKVPIEETTSDHHFEVQPNNQPTPPNPDRPTSATTRKPTHNPTTTASLRARGAQLKLELLHLLTPTNQDAET
jgi:hypothetical protein